MKKEYEKRPDGVYEVIKVKKSVSDLEYDIQVAQAHPTALETELSDILKIA